MNPGIIKKILDKYEPEIRKTLDDCEVPEWCRVRIIGEVKIQMIHAMADLVEAEYHTTNF